MTMTEMMQNAINEGSLVRGHVNGLGFEVRGVMADGRIVVRMLADGNGVQTGDILGLPESKVSGWTSY